MRLVWQIGGNALAIYIASYLLDDFNFTGNITTLLVAALILGVVNFFLKPILKFFLAPLIIFSLGLVSIVINMIILAFIDYLIPELYIATLLALFLGTMIISAVNLFIGMTSKK